MMNYQTTTTGTTELEETTTSSILEVTEQYDTTVTTETTTETNTESITETTSESITETTLSDDTTEQSEDHTETSSIQSCEDSSCIIKLKDVLKNYNNFKNEIISKNLNRVDKDDGILKPIKPSILSRRTSPSPTSIPTWTTLQGGQVG